MAGTEKFKEEYKKLNKAQKDAIDSIDGPVMVVAGPGTGKTQILALRIGNILFKTDIKPDGILCLTFTNAAVDAMKERLARYIGDAASAVNVFTFHSFGMKVIEENYKHLGLKKAPKLLEALDRAILFDEILRSNDWEHLRPRSDSLRYFEDLKSLISLLKRERITFRDFNFAVKKEIKFLENDEASLSTRGESKGELKKEALKEIESLKCSREVVKFIELYEKSKKEKNLLDYDDALESLVELVENSKEVLAQIRERYLYVLVDEHQDSSRVQNEFLTRVWAPLEKPDIFVVGDDRQLIYGFSGADIEYFKSFQKTFKGAKLITLLDNYRSTQIILDASHQLLQSALSDHKLMSNSKESHPIKLVEANSPEEEIIAASIDIKEKISAQGGSALGRKKVTSPSDCAILVPKNVQVRRAIGILHNARLSTGVVESLSLFDQEEAYAYLRVLKIIGGGDPVSLAMSFFDKTSGIEPMEVSRFVAGEYMRDFSLDKFLNKPAKLLPDQGGVDQWAARLAKWKENSEKEDIKTLLQTIGAELFIKKENELVSGQEILDTILGLLDRELEKKPDLTLGEFTLYLEKLASFSEYIPILAQSKDGIKVLTLHGSKGLEFDYVWIAHLDEKSLGGGKKLGFALPENIAKRVEERDIDAIKRKLYVAITRAKRFCTLSYSLASYKGREQELAKIISELPNNVFEKRKIEASKKAAAKNADLSEVIKLAREKYKARHVSMSLLNNFFECPWKWYFRSLLQLPEAPSESLIFGGKVHKAIDQVLKLNKAILPEDNEVRRVVSAWIKNRLPNVSANRENEQPVSFADKRFPHLKIYGRLDLIEKLDSSNVRVTDFKTGSPKRKGEVNKRDEEGRLSGLARQLAMYSYLLQGTPKWNNVKVLESRLEFLEAKNPKESIYSHVVTPEEIGLLIKDIEDYDKLVKSGEWVARECHYNSYGKNTECEYCKLAEIYK